MDFAEAEEEIKQKGLVLQSLTIGACSPLRCSWPGLVATCSMQRMSHYCAVCS